MERWLEKGYFEASDPVALEQAIAASSAYILMGRFGQPEEIARAVLFLASGNCSGKILNGTQIVWQSPFISVHLW